VESRDRHVEIVGQPHQLFAERHRAVQQLAADAALLLVLRRHHRLDL
jgi:hypothetical protein